MDSLVAQADAIRPLKNKTKKSDHENKLDATASSIAKNAGLPKSLRDSAPVEGAQSYNHIANKKLRTQLNRTSEHNARSKALLKDAELLLTEERGRIEVEGGLEKTWRVSQNDIIQQAGQEAVKGRKEWRLDGGPYCSRYSRNGRCADICLGGGFTNLPFNVDIWQ
jgi:U3 small nucleolar RNA-associated protein 7